MLDFKTLNEAILRIGDLYPTQGFTFQDQRGQEITYTFPEIEQETARRAAGLQSRGLVKGERVALVLPDPKDFVLTFLAAVRIGVVPVPLYPPLYLVNLDSYFQHMENILRSSGARVLITSPNLQNNLAPILERVAALEQFLTAESLIIEGMKPDYCDIAPDDLVFLQYTSGSTMNPRGVMVTHRSLLSNVKCFMQEGLEMVPGRDKGVTWLPLYHDMGLIGFVLGPICYGISVVFIPTMRFIKNATVWMETIHAHRAAVSFAPNFAFALVLRRARAGDLARWDLSCIKALGCGAEPIQPGMMREFARVMGDECNLRPTAIMPSYGLAETTLAATMKKLKEIIRFRRVDKTQFEAEGRAIEATNDKPYLEHVSCGSPFSEHSVAIMDDEGRELSEGREGEVCLRGSSIAAGYINNHEAWEASFHDNWLHTGDLGYMADGELYITGRIKDLIIINGRNIHPQQIEWELMKIDGIRMNGAVAFSVPGENSELLIVAVETRTNDTADLVSKIEEAVYGSIFIKPTEVICLRSGALPTTSSGKLKRQQVRYQYINRTLVPETPRTGADGLTEI